MPSLTWEGRLALPPQTLLAAQSATATFDSDDEENNTDHRNTEDNSLTYRHSGPAWHCAAHGDWLVVALGAPTPGVGVWKYTNAKQWELHSFLDDVHERTVRAVAFAPLRIHCPIFASASFDGTVAIWELQKNTNSTTNSTINSSKNTNRNPNNWHCTTQLEGHDNEVKCVVWNRTGSLLATGGRDKTIWVWECVLPDDEIVEMDDTPNNTNDHDIQFDCLAVLTGHDADVKDVQFAPSHGQWADGDEIIVSASYDGTIRIWAEDAGGDGEWYTAYVLNNNNNNNANNINAATIWSLALSPSGLRIVAGDQAGRLHMYQAYTAAEKRQYFPNEDQNQNGCWKCVGTILHNNNNNVTGTGTEQNQDMNDTNDDDDDKNITPNKNDPFPPALYSVAYAPARAGHGRWAAVDSHGCLHVYREDTMTTTNTTTASSNSSGNSTTALPMQQQQQPKFVREVSARAASAVEANCVIWHNGSSLANATTTTTTTTTTHHHQHPQHQLVTTNDAGEIDFWSYRA